MRVSPIGWAFETLNEVLDEAERTAIVTHNHPEGVLGAQAVAASVFLARTKRDREDIATFIRDGCGYEMTSTIDELRPTYAFDASCRGTVPIAVQAFLESTDFEHAIRLAVSVGGDSDTIACITGAIAHAYYGGIPDSLMRPAIEIFMPLSMLTTAMQFCEQFRVPI